MLEGYSLDLERSLCCLMGRGEVRSVKLQLSSIVNGKYMAVRKLGEGGCGVIYEVANLADPSNRLACKAELIREHRDEEILRLEGTVLKALNLTNAIHCGQFIEEGKNQNYNYLIMSLLGPSICNLRKHVPDQKFSLFTCLCITIQSMDAIKEVHDAGFVHRDIKPANFVVGCVNSEKRKIIHILDFGLARSYYTVKDGKKVIRPPRQMVPFRGTARYCSSNAHSRIEVGRNDDLWSLLYVLLEMYNGFLPWREMNRDDTERYKRENEKELFAGCPREFELAMKYVKTLTYSSTPNYKLLRNLLCSLVMRECASDKALDWEPTGKHGEDFAELLAFEYLKRKQPGEKVDLIKILKLPESIPVINDNDFDNAHNSEKLKTNSDNDDTIEGSEKTTKEKTISLNIPYGGYQYRPKGKDANKTKNSKPSMEYTRTTSGETTGGAEQKTQKYD